MRELYKHQIWGRSKLILVRFMGEGIAYVWLVARHMVGLAQVSK